jgi:DNA-binding NarL/FixJ family response regulator
MTPSPLRVLIADDHEMVREGLQLILSEEAGKIEIVGQAANGAECVRLAAALDPDVILMDLVMPGMDGIEATRQIRAKLPAARILILTSFVDDQRVRDALQAGAMGYLMKDMLRSGLLGAIHDAMAGKPTLHPVAQQHLIRQVTRPAPPVRSLLETLTERETDVLRLIARGRSNKEIAAALFLSVGTVKGYVSAILAKLELADRTQAALYATKHGLVSEDT